MRNMDLASTQEAVRASIHQADTTRNHFLFVIPYLLFWNLVRRLTLILGEGKRQREREIWRWRWRWIEGSESLKRHLQLLFIEQILSIDKVRVIAGLVELALRTLLWCWWVWRDNGSTPSRAPQVCKPLVLQCLVMIFISHHPLRTPALIFLERNVCRIYPWHRQPRFLLLFSFSVSMSVHPSRVNFTRS